MIDTFSQQAPSLFPLHPERECKWLRNQNLQTIVAQTAVQENCLLADANKDTSPTQCTCTFTN